MKRMILVALLAFAGLTVCGLLVLRHAVRTAPLQSAPSDLPAPSAVAPIDRLQGSMKLDVQTDYSLDARTKAKLRAEELRQQPWEGRN